MGVPADGEPRARHLVHAIGVVLHAVSSREQWGPRRVRLGSLLEVGVAHALLDCNLNGCSPHSWARCAAFILAATGTLIWRRARLPLLDTLKTTVEIVSSEKNLKEHVKHVCHISRLVTLLTLLFAGFPSSVSGVQRLLEHLEGLLVAADLRQCVRELLRNHGLSRPQPCQSSEWLEHFLEVSATQQELRLLPQRVDVVRREREQAAKTVESLRRVAVLEVQLGEVLPGGRILPRELRRHQVELERLVN
mmetsp:Transcript_60843/g.139514  ORF Transcript_60843/g.139514 Transcript_60843/m.139514 type:complete len:249 (-) Transcript_60843:127-873(-)